MIKPIIGIISREYYSQSNKKIDIVYTDMMSSVIKSGGIPIGIPCNEKIDDYIELCDGFIFQGGDDINSYDLDNLEILREKNVPVLGICLGMQEMFYDNNMKDVDNHCLNSFHCIKVKKKTLLYDIFKKNRIMVNSRHKSVIDNTKYRASGISLDNTIEALEIPYLRFYLGVQWHPENLYDIDKNARRIFDYFILVCKNKK